MTQGIAFEPTPERRNQVEVLAGFGLPQHQMWMAVRIRAYPARKLSCGVRSGLW